MSQRAKDLAARFRAFNEEWIAFVTNCPDEGWRKVSPDEQWPVGVVARHVAASHCGVLPLARMMVAGEPLPELTSESIDQMNAKHAAKHGQCTKDEVLKTLRENGAAIADFLAGISDADLDRCAHLPVAGGEVTTEQVVKVIIIQSGREHLDHVKTATGT